MHKSSFSSLDIGCLFGWTFELQRLELIFFQRVWIELILEDSNRFLLFILAPPNIFDFLVGQLLLLFLLPPGRHFNRFLPREDILSHGDSKLIILIFCQNIILKIFDFKQLFILIDLLLLCILSFDHLLICCLDQVITQFTFPYVNEVNYIEYEHYYAEDQH